MKPLAPDEKLVPVMVYTQNMLVHGGLVAKENVRVSILLRTQGVPNYLHLHNAHAIVFGGTPPKSLSYSEIFIPTPSVIALHSSTCPQFSGSPRATSLMKYNGPMVGT